MASYIRSTTSFALAPLRATHGLLSATYGLVSRTGSEARGLVQGGLEYIRRDRTAPAAALVGLGPLLLGVIRDEKTERALQELMQLLKDALAILQREEVHTITATPVTDLVKHASTTLLSLLRVLQTPAVDKVRSQLDLYFSYLLANEAAAGAAGTSPEQDPAAQAWARAQPLAVAPAAAHTEEVGLRECVQLLLLLELLSASPAGGSGAPIAESYTAAVSGASSTVPAVCCCPVSLAPAHLQAPFSLEEARLLRALIRRRDVQLVMLYRFHLELTRAERDANGDARTQRSRADSRDTSADVESPTNRLRQNGHERTHSATTTFNTTHGRSMSANDSSTLLSSSTNTPGASPAAASSSKYSTPRKHQNFAHKHRSSQIGAPATAAATPAISTTTSLPIPSVIITSVPSSMSSSASDTSHASDEEDLSHDESLTPDAGRPATASVSPAPAISLTPTNTVCPRHVPRSHARFVFCVRELLADRADEIGYAPPPHAHAL